MVCYSTLGFVVANAQSLWGLYLSARQRRAYNTKQPLTATVRRLITEEQFQKTQQYGRDKTNFSIVCAAIALLRSNLTLYNQWTPRLWAWSVRAAKCYAPSFVLRYAASSSFATDLLHCTCYSMTEAVLDMFISLPLSYYRNFVLEEKHGFNRLTVGMWIKDNVKSFLLDTFLLEPITASLVNWVVRRFGSKFPMYLFGCTTALVIAFTYIFPAVIQPLFNKFEPLPEGSLRDKISALAKDLKFPLSRLYVMDGSSRSAHSNAYFYGFWNNKRIVLFDTLLENLDEPEVLAVLSHEFGHWKLNHTSYMLGAGLTQLYVMCRMAKEMIYKDKMYTDLGFPAGSSSETLPPLVGFMIYTMLMVKPMSELFGMGICAVSRAFERQADHFAIQLGYGKELREGLLKMQEKSLTDISPDWLYSACVHTHPPILERVAAIDEELAKKEKLKTD